jgi:hypothetical protein
MAIATELLPLMPDTLIVYSQSSVDKYGKRTFSGSGTSIRCRIQYATDQSTGGQQGSDERLNTPSGKALLYGDYAITTDHRLVLPDSTEAIIRSVNRVRDEIGGHHTVLNFGTAS